MHLKWHTYFARFNCTISDTFNCGKVYTSQSNGVEQRPLNQLTTFRIVDRLRRMISTHIQARSSAYNICASCPERLPCLGRGSGASACLPTHYTCTIELRRSQRFPTIIVISTVSLPVSSFAPPTLASMDKSHGPILHSRLRAHRLPHEAGQ